MTLVGFLEKRKTNTYTGLISGLIIGCSTQKGAWTLIGHRAHGDLGLLALFPQVWNLLDLVRN